MKTLDDIFVGKDNNLTFIRTLAAVAVIYGHSFAVTKDSGSDIVTKVTNGYAFSGGVAVDLFFLISGFLVTFSILKSGVLKYFISRFLRIFPALWIMLFITVFIMGSFVTNMSFFEYIKSSETWKYFSNIFFLYDGAFFLPGVFSENHDQAVNGSIWSIFIEVRLYIILSVVYMIGILNRKTVFNILFFIAIIAGWLEFEFPYFSSNHTNLHVSFLFFVGVFLYLNREDIPISPVVFLLALFIAGITLGTDKFGIGYTLLLSTFFVTVSFFSQFSFFDKYGDPSYGIYLYGWPVENFMVYMYPELNVYENAAISIIVATIIGYISWHVIEKRFLNQKTSLFNFFQSKISRNNP